MIGDVEITRVVNNRTSFTSQNNISYYSCLQQPDILNIILGKT